ncbi:MAG: nuclear transport factor 2 family protein [Chitinophagaceae bacterium]
MKHFTAASALLLCFSFIAVSQTNDEKAIQKLLTDIAVAVKTKDVNKLNQLWADDYIFVSPSGVVADKSQRGKAISESPVPVFFTYGEPKVRFYGNTAVVNSMVHITNPGADTSHNPTSMVFVKKGAQWMVVNGHSTSGAIASNANDEEAIRQIERELLDALLKGDASANERHQAANYVFTGPDGTLIDKAKGIADIKSGDLKFESSVMDDIKVHLYGNTAVFTCRTTDKGKYKTFDLSGQYRWTDTFTKQNGRWQIVAGHGTKIGQL